MTPIEFRRHLHRHPELSFHEEQTAQFIERVLGEEGISCRRVASTGVLATIEGCRPTTHRRAVVLRADVDALPITEKTSLEYASQNKGVMHACGHDMHAAILFGVLQQLRANPDFEGTIFGLFQPGEELCPGGASIVMSEDPFAEYEVVAVVGEHVDAGLEVGEIGFCEGKFMASNDELRITVCGRGGHGAMRSTIDDTVSAAANTVLQLTALNSETIVLSIGKVVADGATNVMPDKVYMEGTMRTFDEGVRHRTWQTIEQVATKTDSVYGTTTTVEISHGYPCVVNDGGLTRLATALSRDKGFSPTVLPPRTTSEDFGFYCTHYPSLFYRLGVGGAAGRSHTATFNPDERAIAIGQTFMHSLALKIADSYGKI